jgi:UDP-3-O-[3-hydroxymyristoyl] glucosamine N-acyltransferase
MKFKQPQTLAQLAEVCNAKIAGDETLLLIGINEIHKVKEKDITFADHPRYIDKALKSDAAAIIVNHLPEDSRGKSFLVHKDPFRAFNAITRHHNLPIEERSFLPELWSNVSRSARIGENSVVMPGCFIGENVVIGDNCYIHPNVTIHDYTEIGNNVIIHPGTVIGSGAFYFKWDESRVRYDKLHSCGRVVIHDYVEIGSNCSIDRGVSGDTVIGKGTKIDNMVMVGHDAEIGQNCLIAAQCGIAGVVVLEDNVVLWGQVGVAPRVRLGKGCVVLAKSGVSKSLEAGKVYFGSPAVEAREHWKQQSILRTLSDEWEKVKKMF